MTRPRTLNVALVGMGYAGQTFHTPLILAEPGLRLTHVVSAQPDTVCATVSAWAQRLAGGSPQRLDAATITVSPSLDAVLADASVDVVVLATPNAAHAPQTLAALSGSKHVMVDKPMALDSEQAQAMAHAAQAAGKHLAVFHNRRWDDDFLAVQALLQSGELGEVRHATLSFDRFRPQVRTRWRESDAPGGGLWLDLGPHLIDQALQLFGAPVQINAQLNTLRPGGAGTDDFVAHLVHANGLRVTLQASMLTAQPRPRFALYGTRGSALIHGLDGQEDALKAGTWPRPATGLARDMLLTLANPAGGLDSPVRALPQGDYSAFYRRLAAHLRGEGPPPVAINDALAVMRLLDVGSASAAQGKTLAL